MNVHFNSHPHEEDDDVNDSVLPKFVFQLTSSRRGWLIQDVTKELKEIFQLTSSRRGWRRCCFWRIFRCDISTHILTKRMTVVMLPHVNYSAISTHILTKRMTLEQRFIWKNLCISTHILTKRMTGGIYQMNKWTNYFNSHPHEEDDNGCVYYGDK